jgi:hypothetical protein
MGGETLRHLIDHLKHATAAGRIVRRPTTGALDGRAR